MPQSTHYEPTFAERYPVSLFAALLDLLMVIGAAYLAYYLRFGGWEMTGRYASATLLTSVTVVMCSIMLGVYGSWRGRFFLRQLGLVYGAWIIAIGVVLALSFFLKVSANYSRIWLGSTICIGIGLCTAVRLGGFFFLRAVRTRGRNLKSVLLVGEGGVLADSLSQGRGLSEYGFRVAKCLPFERGTEWTDALVREVVDAGVHEVWLCLPLKEGDAIGQVLYALRHHPVEVRYFPDLAGIPLLNHKVSKIAGLYALDLSCSPMDGPARIIKRLEDLLIGGLISLLILPLCLGIAIAIKLSSPGPVVFKQYRTGINGKKFKVYKFRSMVVHQETDGAVTQASRNDPRVTRLGAFLRRTSLDELPQFFNVLQGRMSIVGPRPHALAHNEYYKDLVESYMQRHKVKPGITGWAQVNGYRGETDTLEKMQKRVEYDLWYIDNWSLWLDLKIIFLTVFKGFVGKNAY